MSSSNRGKGRPKKRPTQTVRLDAALVAALDALAGLEGASMSDLLAEFVTAPVRARVQALLPAWRQLAKTSPAAAERVALLESLLKETPDRTG